MRQPVQHVEIDRVDAATAHGLNHLAGLLEGLFAIDCLLNPGIEILDTETDACDTQFGECVILGFCQVVRVHFDTDFGILCK